MKVIVFRTGATEDAKNVVVENTDKRQQPLVIEKKIPPAPPDSPKAVLSQNKTTNMVTSSVEEGLEYDESLSFKKNLFRFRGWCESDGHPSSQEFRSKKFLKELYSHAQGDAVVQALQDMRGGPFYRNILLACLLRVDVSGKDKIIWGIALNNEEHMGVRRTAAYLFREIKSTEPRPQELLDLLAIDDSQLKVFVLQSAAKHMDEKGYALVQQLAMVQDDIHVQVAAASAIGQSEFADKGEVLKTIIETSPSSKTEKFSESSIVKRTAIAGMDVADPDTYEMIKSLANDENEDPGVRRRALLKCAEAGTDDAFALVSGLLQSTPEEEAVVIKGCVQGLLGIGGEEAEKAIQNKMETIKDLQIKTMIQHLLEQEKMEQ